MFKIMSLVLLVTLVGCKTLPNFPIVFMSHQDLLSQEREIDSFYERRN